MRSSAGPARPGAPRRPSPSPAPPPPLPARLASAALAAALSLTATVPLPLLLLVPPPPAAAAADSAAVGKCLLAKCRAPLAACLADATCAANLVCLNTCAGRPDETACQIRCGDVHASPAIDKFNDCAVTAAKCVPQRVDDASAYPVPPDAALDAAFDINAFTGRWFITAGLNPLFDTFPCQEHFFGVPEPGKLAAKINWRVPLDSRGRFAPRSTIQTFTQCPNSKALLLNHGNAYLNYQDDWYILASKPDAYVVVYYRGANDAWVGYGGAVVYTKARSFPSRYLPEIRASVERAGLKWADFVLTDNACPPQPPAPTLSERVGDVERVIVDDAVAVEQTIVADARAVEATLAADALAVEKALVADAEAIEQVLAADAVALGRRAAAAVSLPSRAAVAVEQAAAEELREAAAFLEKVEREAVEGPLMRVGRAIGLVK